MTDELFERRKTERRYALNFLDYEILAETGEVVGRGLARTINVSEAGLRLKSSQFFDPGQRLRVTLSLENELIQITGKVVNSRPENDELCSSGIMFLVFEDHDRNLYKKHYESLKVSLA